MDSLGGGADFFEASRTFETPGAAVDWIQFEIWNTPTDEGMPPTTATDFYIRSIKITGAAVPGDVNGDGFVDIFDVNVVSANWGAMGAPGITGDANNDGKVDIFDVNTISANWAPPPAPGQGGAVPEPATWFGALVGALGLGLGRIFALRRLRRRRSARATIQTD